MSESLSDFHFLRPVWLLLIPVAVGVWLLWRQRTDSLRGWRAQMAPVLLDALVAGKGSRSEVVTYGLLTAWMLAVVAIAGPTWKLEPSPFAADSPPLMILLKADESMLLGDPPPSRLERAQLKIADLAAARKGQPLGLVAYAGSSHLVLPPTRDVDVVAQLAAEISPDVMPVPGDRLDLAIRTVGEVLKQSSEGGSLLVMADSIAADPQSLSAAQQEAGPWPVQLLALTEPEAPETQSIRTASRELGGRVIATTPDGVDIESIASYADRNASAGLAGESNRWHEAGYWLTPVLALIVALSFRREKSAEVSDP